MRVLVTRPAADSERTAQVLRASGHEALLAPLLRIEPIADAAIGPGPWRAIAFTSANAMEALRARPERDTLLKVPAFTVGERSAAAARAIRFATVHSAQGDVAALASLLAAHFGDPLNPGAIASGDFETPPPERGRSVRRTPTKAEAETGRTGRGSDAAPDPSPDYLRWSAPPEGEIEGDRRRGSPILYLAAEKRAGDLAHLLAPAHLAVETVPIYRAVAVQTLPATIRAALCARRIDAVLHYSRRTAQAFLDTVAAENVRMQALAVPHLCLSAEVAAPLMAAGAERVAIAQRPNQQALLALLEPWLNCCDHP